MKAGKDFIGLGCGALVINDKDEILLLRYSDTSKTDPGMWARPGGQVEFGEEGARAAEREVEEETGVKVSVVRPLEFTEIVDGENAKHWIALGFLARHVSGTPKLMEPDTHVEIGWFSLDKLPENITSYTKNSIDVFLKSKMQKAYQSNEN
jgi:ADP-ribose pyrophosphatase YjhB (NUDIX family)